ncbi:unnamed protein product, partial [Adineta ricciae]
MFSFLKKTKIKKAEPIIVNENKENTGVYDYPTSAVSTLAHD